MKIQALSVQDYPPIKALEIQDLGTVVIIAGANGSGKTRLKQALVQTLQGKPQVSVTLKATRDEEDKAFGGSEIVVQPQVPNSNLNEYMNSRKFGRGRYVGSLVQIDSQRTIHTTKYDTVNWQTTDPDELEIKSNFYYQPFSSRWQIFMDYIHKKAAAHERRLAAEVKRNPQLTGAQISEKYPDPLEKFKQIFEELLPGKRLQDIDPAKPGEFTYVDHDNNVLAFASLSSGEQEVIKVVFDVARLDIKHSVIIVDEPELHLHPTLAFKLVETLKTVGEHTNQFIFLTHSADLISTYYSTGDVYFIDTVQTGTNQAHRLSDLNRSHKEVVRLIGENLGLFAVGKKLVFVEGEDASLDRLTYHKIAQKYSPDAKIIAVGSVENIVMLKSLEEQIRSAIFGIDLYMIRDRDGLTQEQVDLIESNGRIRCLKKRHLENYFLDADTLLAVAERLYLTTKVPKLSKDLIETELRRIAEVTMSLTLLQNTKDFLRVNCGLKIPTVRGVEEKNVDVVKEELLNEISLAVNELTKDLSRENIGKWIDEENKRLKESMKNGSWRDEFYGKVIFSKICSHVLQGDMMQIRQAYVDTVLEIKPEVFDDITEIFHNFK